MKRNIPLICLANPSSLYQAPREASQQGAKRTVIVQQSTLGLLDLKLWRVRWITREVRLIEPRDFMILRPVICDL